VRALKSKNIGLLIVVVILVLVVGAMLWRVRGLTDLEKSGSEPHPSIVSSSHWDELSDSSALAEFEIRLAAPKIRNGPVRVPFTQLTSNDVWKGDIYFDLETYRSRYLRQDGVIVGFPFPGVPIDMQVIDNGEAVIAFRSIFDNKLWLLSIDATGKLLSAQAIRRPDVDYPLFRAAVAHGGSLYWVIYDNKTRKNYLRSFKLGLGGWEQVVQDLELPSFEPPAGSTYEMEPPVFLHADGQETVEIVGGNWYGKVASQNLLESSRLIGCETAIESKFKEKAPVVLCRASEDLAQQGVSYSIASPGFKNALHLDANRGVPWKLRIDSEGSPVVDYAYTADGLRQVFIRDVSENHFGGVLEFGSNNTEGRVPWSQIYYLNGWMDAILLSRKNIDAFDIYGDLLKDLRLRIELEVRLLDDLVASDRGLLTKAFTFDRSPALFAVQTSRILLLFERYNSLFPDAVPLKSLKDLRSQVLSLAQHIEVLAHEGEEASWMNPGTAHLRWPKGSAFYFDGMPVPFNHQNEWASSIFEMKTEGVAVDVKTLEAARAVIGYFLKILSKDGGFPSVSEWYYWYGHAYDGWKASENRSMHTPEYPGDHGLAWISFRTIDLMSVMSALDYLSAVDKEQLKKTGADRVLEGDVYPFAARSLLEHGEIPVFKLTALQPYLRSEAPWALSNSVWALPMVFGIYKKIPLSESE
jgi:hypothetical protein